MYFRIDGQILAISGSLCGESDQFLAALHHLSIHYTWPLGKCTALWPAHLLCSSWWLPLAGLQVPGDACWNAGVPRAPRLNNLWHRLGPSVELRWAKYAWTTQVMKTRWGPSLFYFIYKLFCSSFYFELCTSPFLILPRLLVLLHLHCQS